MAWRSPRWLPKSFLQNTNGYRVTYGQHKQTQQTILNFIFIIVGIELAALPQIGHLDNGITGILLAVPVPFALLSIYHSAYTMRIHRLPGAFVGGLGGPRW